MTQRNETLATAFEQVSSRLLTVAEGLSDAAWSVTPAGEARTAGQIAYHMAEVYHNVNGFIQMAVDGQPLPALNMEIIHGVNAEQVARYAGVGRADALELLRRNSAATTALLRSLSNDQLDTSTEFFGRPTTVQELAQNALVGHTGEHLVGIQGVAAAA
jgi:uncharacterized damage-inducible protein DinB